MPRAASDLGAALGADLTEREVDWLVRSEWARSADDILWRRSKLGLRFRKQEVDALTGCCRARGKAVNWITARPARPRL